MVAYSYWCPAGQHMWTWSGPDNIEPPDEDGSTVVCPSHTEGGE